MDNWIRMSTVVKFSKLVPENSNSKLLAKELHHLWKS